MRKTTRTNLMLLIAVVVLGAAVWMQVRHEVASFEPPLSSIDPGTAQTLEVRCLQCTSRSFKRIDGQWWMQEPYALPADSQKVARLLAIAGSVVRSRRPLADFTPSRIGLDPPLMSLKVDARQFDIGQTDALNGDRYIRDGEVIAMVPDRFSPYLLATPETELDLHLLPTGNAPHSVRVDGKDRYDLLSAWSTAKATQIQARDAAAKGKTLAQIELVLKNGESVRYQFQQLDAHAAARRESPALDYLLDAQTAAQLLGNDKAQ